MKKNIKLIIGICILIVLTGVSFAWFNYYKVADNQRIITGNLFLNLIDNTDSFTLRNIFPLSKEEARARNDNVITFSISGKNTSEKENIHYEIMLKNGEEDESYERFDPEDLVFDLIEVTEENGQEVETYLLDAISFPSIDGRRIWVDTVLHGTNSKIERTYKLRMWLSDKVIISDSDPNADYTANKGTSTDFKNHYASVKLGVYGDLKLKSLPSNVTTNNSFVENGKSYFMVDLSNDFLLEDEGELLDENDTIRIKITNPEDKINFSYRDSEGNEVLTQSTSLDLTYTYNKNKIITMMVFTESKTEANISTSLNFEVYKNGTKVQEYTKQINAMGRNYCLRNGFTNLAECILVSDNLSQNRQEAITHINTKGVPDVNDTAPSYRYVEEITENEIRIGTEGHVEWSTSPKYVFDESSGLFTLKEADGVTTSTNFARLSDDLIGTYTCGTDDTGHTWHNIYLITSVDAERNRITGTKIEYKVISSLDSQIGLYKVADNDGDSYIYRGAVYNNNVYFGGYYWKILRINGDGSIRMIFNGNTLANDGNKTAGNNVTISSSNDTGINATYPFNSNVGGPTYVGYMNTENTSYWKTTSLATYNMIAEDIIYYFADSFATYTDEYGNRQFKLAGNVYQSKIKDLTSAQINAHPYTCSGTNANLVCSRLVQINSRTSSTAVSGYYITYSPDYLTNSSITKADVEKNEQDSTAKKQIDLWYQNKFRNNLNNGKSVTTYLADSPFCNDRTISDTYTNGSYTLSNSYTSGYLLTANSYYQARRRLMNAEDPYKSATLLCNKNDNFSVVETANANGKLTYPIGLITADEVALAGGKYNDKNENYWLRTNGYFWTMTPSRYMVTHAYARMLYVTKEGFMYSSNVSPDFWGLRPVINLLSNTQISGGDGTATNPYIID